MRHLAFSENNCLEGGSDHGGMLDKFIFIEYHAAELRGAPPQLDFLNR